MLQVKRRANFVCAVQMRRNVYNYSDQKSPPKGKEKRLKIWHAIRSKETTYLILTHWNVSFKHYTRVQLTNERLPYDARHAVRPVKKSQHIPMIVHECHSRVASIVIRTYQPIKVLCTNQANVPSGGSQLYRHRFSLYEPRSTPLPSWFYLPIILRISREPLYALPYKSLLETKCSS